MYMIKTMRIILCMMLIGFLAGCGGSSSGGGGGGQSGIVTFQSRSGDICREDGKPVIRLFSTTYCSHCQWIGDTFNTVAQMYVDDGFIVAHHWELDTGDDLLTSQVEAGVPESELAIYNSFNPQNTIPTFVFGCKYYRIGNGYEAQNDLGAEEDEFIDVIEALLDAE